MTGVHGVLVSSEGLSEEQVAALQAASRGEQLAACALNVEHADPQYQLDPEAPPDSPDAIFNYLPGMLPCPR